jgi:hypothetical protein
MSRLPRIRRYSILEFDELTAYILSKGSFSTEKEKGLKKKWLATMKSKARQWAACYTWARKTYGAHSTGRAEAINSAIKTFCSKHSLILDLMKDLELMSDSQPVRSETESLRQLFESKIVGPGGNNCFPVAEKLADTVEEYAAHIVRSQAAQILLYRRLTGVDVPEMDLSGIPGWDDGNPFGDETVHCVGINSDATVSIDLNETSVRRALDHGIHDSGVPLHWTSISRCTCQFDGCYGLPCRHRFHVG